MFFLGFLSVFILILFLGCTVRATRPVFLVADNSSRRMEDENENFELLFTFEERKEILELQRIVCVKTRGVCNDILMVLFAKVEIRLHSDMQRLRW